MFISKKILVLLLFIASIAYSQKRDEGVFFIQKDQITKFHTVGELDNVKKGELLKLYKERVHEVMMALPYTSLTNESNVRLGDVGITEDSRHIKTLKKGVEDSLELLSSLDTSIDELVAYADTEKIIWSILFYEDVIKKMRMGVQSGF